MKNKVMSTIQKYNMMTDHHTIVHTIVVATSGGVDSMVLLHLLNELKEQLNVTLVVAHMDHGKREDSVKDAQLVRATAAAYGLPYEEAALPKQTEAGNFQAYAREQRYLFFEDVANRYETKVVATAHHANDHLETILSRLMRGTTASASLSGVQPYGFVGNLRVIRPLIERSKEELYAYACEVGVRWREDVTNQEDVYTRNRIRHHVVPAMLDESPEVLDHVRYLSDMAIADEVYFLKQMAPLIIDHVERPEGAFKMSLSWLRSLDSSLRWRLLQRLCPRISRGALMDLLAFVDQDHASAKLDVGAGRVAKKNYDDFYVLRKQVEPVGDYEFELAMDEPVILPTGEKVIVFDRECEKVKKKEAQVTYLCYNKKSLPLKVRNRRAGDRIQLMNQAGHAKVSRVMIDAKVPIDQRDAWPVIVDAEDVVLWVPGLKKSPFCKEEADASEGVWIVFEK
ncbi:MAG: tRNA lysidine(34) synthetase TilS [Turicibacter sp.]|nr:tRNA lysidine(34) synthetase TilS [Turicibacter sp.]